MKFRTSTFLYQAIDGEPNCHLAQNHPLSQVQVAEEGRHTNKHHKMQIPIMIEGAFQQCDSNAHTPKSYERTAGAAGGVIVLSTVAT